MSFISKVQMWIKSKKISNEYKTLKNIYPIKHQDLQNMEYVKEILHIIRDLQSNLEYVMRVYQKSSGGSEIKKYLQDKTYEIKLCTDIENELMKITSSNLLVENANDIILNINANMKNLILLVKTDDNMMLHINLLIEWGFGNYIDQTDEQKIFFDFLLAHWNDLQKISDKSGDNRKEILEYLKKFIPYINENTWPSFVNLITTLKQNAVLGLTALNKFNSNEYKTIGIQNIIDVIIRLSSQEIIVDYGVKDYFVKYTGIFTDQNNIKTFEQDYIELSKKKKEFSHNVMSIFFLYCQAGARSSDWNNKLWKYLIQLLETHTEKFDYFSSIYLVQQEKIIKKYIQANPENLFKILEIAKASENPDNTLENISSMQQYLNEVSMKNVMNIVDKSSDQLQASFILSNLSLAFGRSRDCTNYLLNSTYWKKILEIMKINQSSTNTTDMAIISKVCEILNKFPKELFDLFTELFFTFNNTIINNYLSEAGHIGNLYQTFEYLIDMRIRTFFNSNSINSLKKIILDINHNSDKHKFFNLLMNDCLHEQDFKAIEKMIHDIDIKDVNAINMFDAIKSIFIPTTNTKSLSEFVELGGIKVCNNYQHIMSSKDTTNEILNVFLGSISNNNIYTGLGKNSTIAMQLLNNMLTITAISGSEMRKRLLKMPSVYIDFMKDKKWQLRDKNESVFFEYVKNDSTKEFLTFLIQLENTNILGALDMQDLVWIKDEKVHDERTVYEIDKVTRKGYDLVNCFDATKKTAIPFYNLQAFVEQEEWKDIESLAKKGFLVIHADNAYAGGVSAQDGVDATDPFKNIIIDIEQHGKYTFSCSTINPKYLPGIAMPHQPYAIGVVLSKGRIYSAYDADAATGAVNKYYRTIQGMGARMRGVKKVPIELAVTSKMEGYDKTSAYNEVLPQNWDVGGIFYTKQTPFEDIMKLLDIAQKHNKLMYFIDEDTKEWKIYRVEELREFYSRKAA